MALYRVLLLFSLHGYDSPDVAVEEVPREAHHDAQLGGLLGRDEADPGDLGDAAGGDDGADEEEGEHDCNEDDHRVDNHIEAAEAEDCIGIIDPGALLDAEEDGAPVGAEEEKEKHETGGDGEHVVLDPLVRPHDGECDGVA